MKMNKKKLEESMPMLLQENDFSLDSIKQHASSITQYSTVDDVNALLLSFSNYVISCMVKYEILKPKNLNSKHHYCNDHIIKLIDKRRAILSNQQYRNSSKGRDELILLINN